MCLSPHFYFADISTADECIVIVLCFTGNVSVLSNPESLGSAWYVEASSLQRR